MGKKGEFFIRVPKADGVWEYIDVDVTRLSPSILTELYVPEKGRRFVGRGFQLFQGDAEGLIHMRVDTSELIQELEHLMDQWRDILDAAGEASRRMKEEILGRLRDDGRHELEHQLKVVIRSVAEGKPMNARNVLRAFIYHLMAATADFAQRVEDIEVLQQTVQQSDEITQDTCLSWALATEEFVKTAQNLVQLRSEMEAYLTEFKKKEWWWAKMFDLRNERVREARLFLDNTEAPDDFFLRALTYERQERIDQETIRSDVTRAREAVAQLHRVEQSAQSEWEEMRREGLSMTPRWQAHLGTLLRDLQTQQEKFAIYHQNYGKRGVLLPYIVDHNLCSKELYEQAVTLLGDPERTPLALEQRLNGVFGAILRRIQDTARPSWPQSVAQILTGAEAHIERLEALLTAPIAQVPAPSREITAVPTACTEDEIVGLRKSPSVQEPLPPRPAPSNGKNRVGELYECIVAVGYILTCNKRPLAASTVTSLLHVLPYLGVATDEEVRMHAAAVNTLVMRRDSRTVVSGSSEFIAVWKTTEATWVECKNILKQKTISGLKVSLRAAPAAQAFLVKYNCDEEKVRAAYTRKRTAQEKRYRERKERTSSI